MALGNSIGSFYNLLSKAGYSSSNLYLIQIIPCSALLSYDGPAYRSSGSIDSKDLYSNLIDAYCDEVTIPSKQLTTGEIKTFGTMTRYPTSTTYNEITMSFMVDKYSNIRKYFENWMGVINSDVSHHVTYYNDIVSPYINITKYERGWEKDGFNTGIFDHQNVETSVYRMYKAFPYNIGSMSMSSSSSQILKFQVSFYYERYRWMEKESDSATQNFRTNRSRFYNSGQSISSRTISRTKSILESNSKRKELGLPPFNNVDGNNPQ
jgi:hypothetical protein